MNLGTFNIGLTDLNLREESAEDSQRRFEIECEFVQSLANPHYVNCKFLSFFFFYFEFRFGSKRIL